MIHHEVAAMASEMHSEPSHRSRSPIRCFPSRDDREFACRPVFLIVSLRPMGTLGGEAARFNPIESVQMSCSDEAELNAVYTYPKYIAIDQMNTTKVNDIEDAMIDLMELTFGISFEKYEFELWLDHGPGFALAEARFKTMLKVLDTCLDGWDGAFRARQLDRVIPAYQVRMSCWPTMRCFSSEDSYRNAMSSFRRFHR